MKKTKNIFFITGGPSTGGIIISGLTIFCGLIISNHLLIMGIVQSFAAFAWMIHRDEIWFNVNKGLYKKAFNIFGIPFGRWKTLPSDKFILLKKLTQSANLSSVFGDFTHRVYYYKIFLKTRQPKRSLELMAFRDEKIAIEEAQRVAAVFGVDLKMDMDSAFVKKINQ